MTTPRQQGRKLLVPYLVGGDPNPTVTLQLMHALVQQGADLIELGFPFSDPSSDGPVIQRGAGRALRGGTTLSACLTIVRDFRASNNRTPVVLMGYLNPVARLGYARFAEQCASSGVDGVLIVDLPPDETTPLSRELARHAIDRILLVAPTTTAAPRQNHRAPL